MSGPAAKGRRQGGGSGPRPAIGRKLTQPRLSHLLVLTAAALALLLCVRLPATLKAMIAFDRPAPLGDLAEPFRGGSEGAPTSPATSVVEPAAGPSAPLAAQDVATGGDGDPMTVTAVQELAAELARRETALAQREQSLAAQEAAMALVEERIRQQSAELEALRASTTAVLGQVTAEDEARAAQLSRMYEAMKPRNAAAIFEELALDLVLPIVRGMRDTKVSAVVAAMSPDKARALTAELARKRTAALPQ